MQFPNVGGITDDFASISTLGGIVFYVLYLKA